MGTGYNKNRDNALRIFITGLNGSFLLNQITCLMLWQRHKNLKRIIKGLISPTIILRIPNKTTPALGKGINKRLKILIDTGATACNVNKGIYDNAEELVIKKRIKTVNGYSIITHFHNINIFGKRHRFYEINNLDADLLVGYNLLKEIKAVIDLSDGSLHYNNKTEKINLIKHAQETVGNLMSSDEAYTVASYLGYQNGKYKTFSLFNVSDTESSSLSVAERPQTKKQRIENKPGETKRTKKKSKKSRRRKMSVSSTTSSSLCKVNHSINEIDLNILEQQVVQEIEEKHSQIQTSLPFRTDIRGEIRTINDNAIYSKQYPYLTQLTILLVRK